MLRDLRALAQHVTPNSSKRHEKVTDDDYNSHVLEQTKPVRLRTALIIDALLLLTAFGLFALFSQRYAPKSGPSPAALVAPSQLPSSPKRIEHNHAVHGDEAEIWTNDPAGPRSRRQGHSALAAQCVPAAPRATRP